MVDECKVCSFNEISKKMECIVPLNMVFDDNFIPIVFASSEYFLPYLSVAIVSIIKNLNKNTKLDIVILCQNISVSAKKKFLRNFEFNFVSIRFVDVASFFSELELFTYNHVSIETYFRILAPLYMKNYDKIIYLDADLVVLSDISDLHRIEISSFPIAGAHECLISALIALKGADLISYLRHELKLKDVEEYMQGGVQLINVNYFNEHNLPFKFFVMILEKNFRYVDQDAINQLLHGKIKWISNDWNYIPLQKHMIKRKFLENMSDKIRKIYLSVQKPKILHFADFRKPWFYLSTRCSGNWWFYAFFSNYFLLIVWRYFAWGFCSFFKKCRKTVVLFLC